MIKEEGRKGKKEITAENELLTKKNSILCVFQD